MHLVVQALRRANGCETQVATHALGKIEFGWTGTRKPAKILMKMRKCRQTKTHMRKRPKCEVINSKHVMNSNDEKRSSGPQTSTSLRTHHVLGNSSSQSHATSI